MNQHLKNLQIAKIGSKFKNIINHKYIPESTIRFEMAKNNIPQNEAIKILENEYNIMAEIQKIGGTINIKSIK